MRARILLRSFVPFVLFTVVCLRTGVHTQATEAGPKAAYTEDGISVYFSPGGGCTEAIVQQLGQARRTIQVQAYSFTSAPIAKALLEAHKRGVKVTVLLDASQRTAQYSSATFLRNAGIAVWIDDKHSIAHNKVVLIDGQTVITGSFNFSKAAEESNAENLVILQGRTGLCGAYDRNFQAHLGHAVKYEGPTPQGGSPAQGRPESSGRGPQAGGAAAAGTGQASPAAAAEAVVHVTRTGKKYHRPGCSSLAKSDLSMKLGEAKAAGLTPCPKCRPAE